MLFFGKILGKAWRSLKAWSVVQGFYGFERCFIMEKWEKVHGFANYSVSTYGNVRQDVQNRLLRLSLNQYGVQCVGMMRKDSEGRHKQYHRSVPLLVLNAFVPRPGEAFDTPINLDGDRTNNRVSNLMWRPRWFAVKYNRQFVTPYEYPVVTPIMDVKTEEVYEDSMAAAKKHGLLEQEVVLSILNRTYVWPTYQQFGLIPD